MSRPQEVSTDAEEILHDPVNRREPLELSGRLETPHLALPLTRRLVGDLGSIVRVLIGDVDHRRHHGAARGGVGAQLVGDQSSRTQARTPHSRGMPAAGRRALGLSLWRPGPEADWLQPDESEPPLTYLPSRLWLIGLGHLGQAYLWGLGLLPYKDPADVALVLQDIDVTHR